MLFSDGCDIFVITRMLFSDALLELRSRVWFVMKPANVYTQNDIVVQKVGFAKGGWDLKKIEGQRLPGGFLGVCLGWCVAVWLYFVGGGL